jgi:formate dehydrogenase major subunit
MVLELLLTDMPEEQYTLDNKLLNWSKKLNIGKSRFKPREQPRADISHPAIAVNLDACIQCTRCVRACREVQVNDVIGYAGRGEDSKIVFDFDDPMGDSTCVACGECVQACPGARRRSGENRQEGRLGLPVLRRGLPPHLPRQGKQDPLGERQGRPVEP